MYKPGLKIHPRCMAQKAHLFHLAAPHGTRCCVCSSASKTMPRALKSLGFLARKKKQRKTPKGWAAPPTLFHIYFNSTCIWMLFDWFEITCLTSAMTTIISLHRHLRRSAWHYLILSLSLSPPIAISTGETDLGDQHVSPIYSTVSIIVMWGHNS